MKVNAIQVRKKGQVKCMKFLFKGSHTNFQFQLIVKFDHLLVHIAKEKKEKNKEGSCNNDTTTDTNNHTRFPTKYDDFIKEAIKEAVDNDKLDCLKPATVLTQAKEYFKSMKKRKIKKINRLRIGSKQKFQH